jgi:hypothetical protein
VWHCSVASKLEYPIMRRETLAREVLEGVGDGRLGEWIEDARVAFHLRRRLTAVEACVIGPVIDVRGTPEGMRRVRALLQASPHLHRMAYDEARI